MLHPIFAFASSVCLLLTGLLFPINLAGASGIVDTSTSIRLQLDTASSIHDDTAQISYLLNAGYAYRKGPHIHEPENPFLVRALKLAEKTGDSLQLAKVYNALAVDQRNAARYLVAVNYGKQALDLAANKKDTVLLCSIYNNIGVAYRRLDENQQAFEYHMQALRLAEACHNWRNQAVAINSIGNIYLSLKQYDKAIASFQQSLEIEESHDNDLGLAINYANIGLAMEGKNQYDRAVDYFLRSLHYNQLINSVQGKLISYNNLGRAYRALGQYTLSLGYFMKALQLSGQIGDVIDVSDSHISIGYTYLLQKKYAEAYHHISEGLNIARSIQSKSLIMQAYQALQDYYARLGDFKQSMEMLQNALNYKDSMLNEKLNNRMAELDILYQLDRKNAAIQLLQKEAYLKELESNRNMLIALFLLGFIVVIIVGGYFVIRHRELKMHQKALQLELQSLRSRMNPHFIFNSLNSIHKYIWTNQPEEASDYLTKFARLIRMILENSERDFIPLSKEIEFLSIYVELENLRCNHGFAFILQVDECMDTDDIMIAPLMIQPFVENAIWHGLAPRKKGGILKISMKLHAQQKLQVEIEDNGIGRQKAEAIKMHKHPQHLSMGLRLTEERLKLLQSSLSFDLQQIQIIDLVDDNQQSCGTKVILELPVEFAYS